MNAACLSSAFLFFAILFSCSPPPAYSAPEIFDGRQDASGLLSPAYRAQLAIERLPEGRLRATLVASDAPCVHRFGISSPVKHVEGKYLFGADYSIDYARLPLLSACRNDGLFGRTETGATLELDLDREGRIIRVSIIERHRTGRNVFFLSNR